jgi:hypothetical protein
MYNLSYTRHIYHTLEAHLCTVALPFCINRMRFHGCDASAGPPVATLDSSQHITGPDVVGSVVTDNGHRI